jgi:hypothetical protein
MNEEMYIQEKVGKRNPFRVPEGYFDNLTAQVMSNLPEQPKRRAKSVFMRPAFYAVAASVCALLVAGAALMWSPSVEVSSPTAVQAKAVVAQPQQQDASGEYMEEAADYMMLDNHEIYAYLAEN